MLIKDHLNIFKFALNSKRNIFLLLFAEYLQKKKFYKLLEAEVGRVCSYGIWVGAESRIR